jgi:hypothetical protein
MEPRTARRTLAILSVWLGVLGAGPVGPPLAWASPRGVDPAQVVPLDQIAPGRRESVAEVIRDHSFHRKGAAETFPCNASIYLGLLNEPALTLALWKDLSPHPARLQQVGPGRYRGTDGSGTTATWEYVLRSPRLHVLLCDLDYLSPHGNAHLEGRIVLVVRSGFFREVNGEPWVQHEVEAFVKIDSRGWRTVARTVRPLIEKVLEDQVQEAGWFVSLMGRLVENYPNWACVVTHRQEQIPADVRQVFTQVVQKNRKPNASPGRPQAVAQNSPPATRRR